MKSVYRNNVIWLHEINILFQYVAQHANKACTPCTLYTQRKALDSSDCVGCCEEIKRAGLVVVRYDEQNIISNIFTVVCIQIMVLRVVVQINIVGWYQNLPGYITCHTCYIHVTTSKMTAEKNIPPPSQKLCVHG